MLPLSDLLISRYSVGCNDCLERQIQDHYQVYLRKGKFEKTRVFFCIFYVVAAFLLRDCSLARPGADSGFWFGRGTGRESGDGSSPVGSRGRSPMRVWGKHPREARRMLRRLRREKSKTDIVLQYNYHRLIPSSFFVSRHFCLKIQNAVCRLQSQRNGPQWQPVQECSLDGLAERCTPPADSRSSSFGQQIAFCCCIRW